MSQGDAGAQNLRQFVEETVEASRTRVIAAINLSSVGESATAGCFTNLERANVDACVQALEANRKHIWGIAVNVSRNACGDTDPRAVLRRGLEAAERSGLPILYGMRRFEDWPAADQLRLLRPGDVVTYCFRREPHCIVEEGRVLPAVRDARQRGILFDVGHGTASFDFDVAEAALGDGFPPDTISTDWQAKHAGCKPAHDLPRVMAKLLAAGMNEADVFAAATWKSAEILRNDEIGSLTVNACADLTVLGCNDDELLHDVNGNRRRARCWYPRLTVRAGAIV